LVRQYPTTDLKTVQIPPLWCWEGIGMFTAVVMGWKAVVFTEWWEVHKEAVGPGGVPLAWEDTFLRQLMELAQAQNSSETVRSRATQWCYQSRLKTLSLIQWSNFMWALVKKSCLVVGALYERYFFITRPLESMFYTILTTMHYSVMKQICKSSLVSFQFYWSVSASTNITVN
jgi:hypothetical protein